MNVEIVETVKYVAIATIVIVFLCKIPLRELLVDSPPCTRVERVLESK